MQSLSCAHGGPVRGHKYQAAMRVCKGRGRGEKDGEEEGRGRGGIEGGRERRRERSGVGRGLE